MVRGAPLYISLLPHGKLKQVGVGVFPSPGQLGSDKTLVG